MKRSALALSIMLVLLFSAAATIGNFKVTSAATENWVEVARYTGTGFIGLYPPEKFTISHSEWRAKWHVVKADEGSGLFHLKLSLSRNYSVGSAYSDSSGPTSGTIVVHNQNRTFSIQVNTSYVQSWAVIIEENIDSPLLDVTDPIVSIISPENKTYYTEDVELIFTVNESTQSMGYHGYHIDYSNGIPARNRTLTGLAEGSYSITIYAKDEAGNIGFSKTIYFSVEEPFPTALILAAAISLSVVGLGLLFLLREIKKIKDNSKEGLAAFGDSSL